MRYKLLLCAFVLLIATPMAAQEFSPIVVETGKPTPSVVKSGEPFKITYRARFFDTVVISEEEMQPDNIVLDKVEVIGLEIKKERVSNDTLGYINVWDFTYTFRIIQPEKGVKKIPSFNFIWVEKKAGVTVEETKDKEKPREMPTEEIGVNYVSSIVKPPPLDIRDEINFVSPITSGAILRRWAYGLMVTAFLMVLIVIFRFARYSKNRRTQEAERESDAEVLEDSVVGNTEPVLSPKQARKKFLKELKELRMKDLQIETQLSPIDLEKKYRIIVRNLLLAELRGTIWNSMSANEIYTKLRELGIKQKKQIGWKYAIMLELARRVKSYQEDVDSNRFSLNFFAEIDELKALVSYLNFYKRVLHLFRPFRIDEVVR